MASFWCFFVNFETSVSIVDFEQINVCWVLAVKKLQKNCLSVFDHLVGLGLKDLITKLPMLRKLTLLGISYAKHIPGHRTHCTKTEVFH